MKKIAGIIAATGLALVAAGLWITRPATVDGARFADLSADVSRGAAVFDASGCASCHATNDTDRLALGGGKRFATPFGTFVAPNISPDAAAGIGGWTLTDFANALLEGTSPEGRHYYPAFPYAAYTHMSDADVADLWAYMASLPPSPRANEPHELGFPFNLRVALGGWKLFYLRRDFVRPEDGNARGRYLVEALGHCAECHTPRTLLGGLDRTRWMAGAPNPSGKGRIPGLTPAQLDWSAEDIAYFLETGFTPDFDSAGGTMAEVIANTSRLTPEDRAAIAAYLKALPAAE